MENLPDKILDWLGSDEVIGTIANLNDYLGVPVERRDILPRLIMGLFAGSLTIDNLGSELQNNLGITDNTKIGGVVDVIKNNIVAPANSYSDSARTAPPPMQRSNSQPPPAYDHPPRPPLSESKDVLLKPSVTETPFILHQHEEETKPQVEAVPVETSPLRPMFYKASTAPPPIEEKALESRPIAARLELGVETQPVQESVPKLSRTPREEIRQVNYSEFRTPLNNPFAGTPGPKESDQESESGTAAKADSKNETVKKPTVPDTNVVNLKDLPL